MDKYFVTYEQALALKELGFDEPSFGHWLSNKTVHVGLESSVAMLSAFSGLSFFKAPLYSQAFEWFRTKHKLHTIVTFDRLKESDDDEDSERYSFTINEQWTIGKDWYDYSYGFKHYTHQTHFDTYQQAESACLDELIKIVKQC